MTTKEKILNTSLRLFNERGTEIITTRHIAAEMKMSHGNLCYHFPKKEEIIQRLYYSLVKELDEEIVKSQSDEISITMLTEMAKFTFAIQLKYKFFLIEIVKIMRAIPEIKEHFKALYHKREAQFTFIIKVLIEKGYFKGELFKNDYHMIIKQFYLIGDFWISEAEILFEGNDVEKLHYYHNLAINFFTPYFTEKSIKELELRRLI